MASSPSSEKMVSISGTGSTSEPPVGNSTLTWAKSHHSTEFNADPFQADVYKD
jgi:hypothetical protein